MPDDRSFPPQARSLITLGEEGSLLYKDENKCIKVPAQKVKAIDTVAAGDCYNGAFIKALAEGMNEEDAMKYASIASAIAVTRSGAQESIPTEDEVKNFNGKRLAHSRARWIQ